MDEVEKVKYILHPTFKQPLRLAKDPNDNFSIKTNGWGTFDIKAVAYMKDGSKIKLEHSLELHYDPSEGTSE